MLFEKIEWSEFRRRHRHGRITVAFRKIINLLARFTLNNALRVIFYRCTGVTVGKNVYIGGDCSIDDNFPEVVSIEDDVIISHRVTVVAHDRSRLMVAPILIQKGAFIGTGSIVLPGVTVGHNSVVGAGSVVTKDVNPYTVVAGSPAKIIKKLEKSE
ncbi:MAG: acyltransferase [Elusimicrobia bacterium]|nr:acyltransferase [Elusimicrobiota bacterium]